MKTFYDIKELCETLQEKQNKLLEIYGKQKISGVIDDEVVVEFNKLAFAASHIFDELESLNK